MKKPAPTVLLKTLLALAILCLVAACNSDEAEAPPALPEGYAIGPTNICQAIPQFVAPLGFEQPMIDTTQELGVGLLIVDMADINQVYQHETWDDAGKIGPFALDWLGNIFVGPTPVISQEMNPVEEQNKVFKADTRTAVLTQFLDLPWPLPPSGSNPYGVLGLAYDCETDSLYVATIAGSTAQEEVGIIYQVSASSGEILSQLEQTDAIGIGLFKGSAGKRLYFGSARTGEVYSVLLAENGRILPQRRLELSLADYPGGATFKAQRLQFTTANSLTLKAIEFNYSLQPTNYITKNSYTFHYQPETDSWLFQDVTSQ